MLSTNTKPILASVAPLDVSGDPIGSKGHRHSLVEVGLPGYTHGAGTRHTRQVRWISRCMRTHPLAIVAAMLGLLSAGDSTNAAESASLAGPNKVLYEYLGDPVMPPTNLASAYTKEGLTSAMHAAAKAAGISLTKLEIDDSEFPFLVGVICANSSELEKLKKQLRKMSAYHYAGGVGDGASYAMNLVPSTAFPGSDCRRIYRRMSLRQQILFDRIHEEKP